MTVSKMYLLKILTKIVFGKKSKKQTFQKKTIQQKISFNKQTNKKEGLVGFYSTLEISPSSLFRGGGGVATSSQLW